LAASRRNPTPVTRKKRHEIKEAEEERACTLVGLGVERSGRSPTAGEEEAAREEADSKKQAEQRDEDAAAADTAAGKEDAERKTRTTKKKKKRGGIFKACKKLFRL